MSESKTCRTCGATVPASAPFGHCPKCLLELGFGPIPDWSEIPVTPEGVKTFGDYELVEPLGRGGMGVVYKARQVRLNRFVALKMISAGEFASAAMVQRFHREAEAAANLHHPNIVPIYEIGELRGQHFFSMQLIEGAGLEARIGRDGYTARSPVADVRGTRQARQEEIACIVMRVARAVDYAHQRGVLHRDLKPSNIILDADGEPHLTDFGVAKVMGRDISNLTASGAIMGTPSYMAPEQAAGDSKRITVAADIYSLGAVLYTMLTGSPPFRATSPVETLRQVVEQEPRHPSTIRDGLDSDLSTIAMKCLEKEPQRRYASASELAEDLERWMRHEPIHARPIRTSERFLRWCRRNPRMAILVSAVALLLTVLAVGSTVVAIVFVAQREVIRRDVVRALVAVYEKRSVDHNVTSQTRRALNTGIISLVRKELKGWFYGKPSNPELELYFVLYPYESPTNTLETFSPFLDELEDQLTNLRKEQVRINLLMHQDYAAVISAMDSDYQCFARMGPASYIELLDRKSEVSLLAMQDHDSPLSLGVFVRSDGEVARRFEANTNAALKELVTGSSLGLGDTNSTTGYQVACWYFETNGVFAKDFSRYQHFGGQSKVISAVLDGIVDVGVGNLDLIIVRPELRVIAQYPLPGELGLCWAAGTKLDNTVRAQLESILLRLRDRELLGKLESDVKGFKVYRKSDMDWLREVKAIEPKPFFSSRSSDP